MASPLDDADTAGSHGSSSSDTDQAATSTKAEPADGTPPVVSTRHTGNKKRHRRRSDVQMSSEHAAATTLASTAMASGVQPTAHAATPSNQPAGSPQQRVGPALQSDGGLFQPFGSAISLPSPRQVATLVPTADTMTLTDQTFAARLFVIYTFTDSSKNFLAGLDNVNVYCMQSPTMSNQQQPAEFVQKLTSDAKSAEREPVQQGSQSAEEGEHATSSDSDSANDGKSSSSPETSAARRVKRRAATTRNLMQSLTPAQRDGSTSQLTHLAHPHAVLMADIHRCLLAHNVDVSNVEVMADTNTQMLLAASHVTSSRSRASRRVSRRTSRSSTGKKHSSSDSETVLSSSRRTRRASPYTISEVPLLTTTNQQTPLWYHATHQRLLLVSPVRTPLNSDVYYCVNVCLSQALGPATRLRPSLGSAAGITPVQGSADNVNQSFDPAMMAGPLAAASIAPLYAASTQPQLLSPADTTGHDSTAFTPSSSVPGIAVPTGTGSDIGGAARSSRKRMKPVEYVGELIDRLAAYHRMRQRVSSKNLACSALGWSKATINSYATIVLTAEKHGLKLADMRSVKFKDFKSLLAELEGNTKIEAETEGNMTGDEGEDEASGGDGDGDPDETKLRSAIMAATGGGSYDQQQSPRIRRPSQPGRTSATAPSLTSSNPAASISVAASFSQYRGATSSSDRAAQPRQAARTTTESSDDTAPIRQPSSSVSSSNNSFQQSAFSTPYGMIPAAGYQRPQIPLPSLAASQHYTLNQPAFTAPYQQQMDASMSAAYAYQQYQQQQQQMQSQQVNNAYMQLMMAYQTMGYPPSQVPPSANQPAMHLQALLNHPAGTNQPTGSEGLHTPGTASQTATRGTTESN